VPLRPQSSSKVCNAIEDGLKTDKVDINLEIRNFSLAHRRQLMCK